MTTFNQVLLEVWADQQHEPLTNWLVGLGRHSDQQPGTAICFIMQQLGFIDGHSSAFRALKIKLNAAEKNTDRVVLQDKLAKILDKDSWFYSYAVDSNKNSSPQIPAHREKRAVKEIKERARLVSKFSHMIVPRDEKIINVDAWPVGELFDDDFGVKLEIDYSWKGKRYTFHVQFNVSVTDRAGPVENMEMVIKNIKFYG